MKLTLPNIDVFTLETNILHNKFLQIPLFTMKIFGCVLFFNQNLRPLHFLRGIVFTLSLVVFNITQFMNLVFCFGNIEEMTKNAGMALPLSLGLFRMFTYFLNWSRFLQMLKDVHEDITEILISGTKDELAIYQKNLKYIRRLSIGIWVLSILTTSLIYVNTLIQVYSLKPSTVINVTSSTPLIYPSWYPFYDNWEHIYFVYFTQIYVTCLAVIMVLSINLFTVTLMIFVRMRLELICNKLQNIEKFTSGFNQCGKYLKVGNAHPEVVNDAIRYNILKSCVESQIKIKRFVEDFGDLTRTTFFLEFLIYTVLLCAYLYQASKAPIGLDIAISLMCICIMGGLLWFSYWHANNICHQSEQIPLSIYCSGWYNYSPKIKRSCLIMIAASSNPIKMNAFFFDMNLDTFVSILKAAYTYFNILRQLDNK